MKAIISASIILICISGGLTMNMDPASNDMGSTSGTSAMSGNDMNGTNSSSNASGDSMSDMSDMTDMTDMSDMTMSMYFTANSDIIFLINGWESKTPGGAVLGCFLTFFFCFAGTFLNYYKRIYLRKVNAQKCHSFVESEQKVNPTNSMRVRLHLTLIFMIQTAFGGLVMLLYMTYSVWAFIAVVLGLAAGYFVAESKYDVKASSGGHHC